MRALLPGVIFFIIPAFVARAEPVDPGTVAIKAALLYCIAPIAVGDDVARLAKQSALPELQPAAAKLFLPKGGRAFALPDAFGEVVLLAHANGMCDVAIRTLDVTRFWTEIDHWFGPGTPWKSTGQQKRADGMTKTYDATLNGPITAIVSARNRPVDKGMQGLLTFSHFAPNPSP